MFDIRKALVAALAVSPDRAKRGEFAQFLLRLSDKNLPVSQWRTVGGTADMIEKFLTELGFGPDDYELYVSKLDPSVRDFRWGRSGKYEALCAVMSELDSSIHPNREANRWIPALAVALSSGDDSGTESLCAMPDTSREHVSDDTKDTKAKSLPMVHDVTSARVSEFATAVEAMKAESEIHDQKWNENLARAMTAANELGFESDVSAIPDLGTVETIVRTLGLVKKEDCPPFWVFASTDELGRYRMEQKRTVMRYMRIGETMKGEETLFGGLVPMDFAQPFDRNGNPNPLVGYVFNDRETASKVDVSTKSSLVMFGFEALNRKPDDRLELLSFATDHKKFWSYVRKLYSAFFGNGVNVSVHWNSRLAISNSSAAWASSGNGGTVPVYRTRIAKTIETFDLKDTDVLAVFCVAVSVRNTSAACRPEAISDMRPVVSVKSQNEAADEDTYSSQGFVTGDLPYEVYEMVHRLRGPTSIRGYHGYHTQSSEQSSLRDFRSSVVRSPSPKRLREEVNYDTSRYLKPEMSRYDHNEYSPVSAFVTGIGIAMKTSNPVGPVEYSVWSGPGKEYHGSESVISAVYSGISATGTHFGNLMSSALVDGNPYRLDMSAKDVDDWIEAAPKGQFDAAPKGAAYGRAIVVETNVRYYEGFGNDQSMWNGIRKLTMCTLCSWGNNPKSASGQDGIQSYMLNRGIENSFVQGVSMGAYLSEVGATGLSSSTVQPDNLMKVRYAVDSHGRIVIAVALFGILERQNAIMYRWECGTPYVEAATLARKLGMSSPTVFTVPEDKHNDPDTVVNYLSRSLKVAPNDNGLDDWYSVPRFPMAPWYRRHARTDTAEAPARADYDGCDLDPSMMFTGS